MVSVAALSSCSKSEFADNYADPKTVASTTVDKQFAGFLAANQDFVMYKYWNYFVILQNTLLPWTQSVGIINAPGRYVPGAAAISDRWGNYYGFLAQYKDLLRVYNTLSAEQQQENRMYIIAATIYFYDHTQKVVDLHGDIPWSEAGLLGTYGGDYQKAAAKYDNAEDIYTKMLDDLKGFADELNSITLSSATATVMNTQDFINHGDVQKWKKYCNSLRLRILMRVSGVSSFQSRVSSEIAAILGNTTSYPLVLTNDDNIQITVVTPSSGINNGSATGASASFYTGLIGWGGGDVAGKVMIDHMKTNVDPRLRAMFQPGASAGGVYLGLDPSLGNTAQTDLVNGGTMARYNFSTISQNIMIPGALINAAEVNYLLAEYYLESGSDASAEAAYKKGINASIDYYYWLRSISNDNTTTVAPTNQTEKDAYIASADVAWSGTDDAKLNKIATQKWIHFSVLQPIENWSEIRRLKLPALSFVSDAGTQTLPPNRWVLPSNELTFNSENYAAVSSKDNLDTKIFWDVK
ncbi:MAG: SusD/RagB family nutrient-binding outer membrane lipoprotein [Terrimonas sp.]|nr:SusD/RagB family nutrient-binding outer membrane lipoprotein [Terrimonas sp.]